MSSRTIIAPVGPDGSLKLQPKDADFLGLKKGMSCVMKVHRDDANPGAGIHITMEVVEGGGTKREPRAFKA